MSSLDQLEIMDQHELNTNSIDELLQNYKINQRKLVKVEHHIQHLEEPLNNLRSPKVCKSTSMINPDPNKPGSDCSNHSRQIIDEFTEATKTDLTQTDRVTTRTDNLTNKERLPYPSAPT